MADKGLPLYIAGEYRRSMAISNSKNFLWIVARNLNTVKQSVPSWTGFNIARIASLLLKILLGTCEL